MVGVVGIGHNDLDGNLAGVVAGGIFLSYFEKLKDLPFIVSYARNTSFVFAAWKRMARIVAATA